MTQGEYDALPPHVQQYIHSVEEADILPTKSTYLVHIRLNDVYELTKANMEHLLACPTSRRPRQASRTSP